MKVGRAIWVGVLGAVVMALLLAIARQLGLPAKLALWLGTIVVAEQSIFAWVLGYVIHLVFGGLFGVVYAIAFEFRLQKTGWLTGLSLSVVHTIVSGVLLMFMPAINPMMPEVVMAPGMFMANLGMSGVLAFAALHLVFGAIAGSLYGQLEQTGADQQVGVVADA